MKKHSQTFRIKRKKSKKWELLNNE
jgi:hypothetical protein